jgi:calcium-dependent protein kinase
MGKVPLLGRYHELPRQIEHDFKLTGKVLGDGYNGSVKMAVRKNAPDSGETFAVKSFNLSKMSPKGVVALEAEIQIFLCLDHPHIARLVNVYETPDCLSLVMECMSGGELFDRVTAAKRFQEPQAAHVTQQMLLALHYLHSHGIVHRDVKLENFLYDEKDGELLKLIDFGFSKFRERGAKMKTACGTLSYVAPEVLTDSYTSQCDLWSLGVIVFVLLSGSMPFHGNSDAVKSKITAGQFLMRKDRWELISPEATAFTKALLEKDPKIRLTAQQALEHPWIQGRMKEVGTFEPNRSMMVALSRYNESPKFRRCCLNAMAWLLSNNETAKLREEFLAMDTDRQGTISLKELKTMMMQKFKVAESDVVTIFDSVDANHDKEIHYSEFLAAMLSSRIELNDKLLDNTFRNFDKDLTGYITVENLHECFGEDFEGVRVDSLIKEADVLKDGKISFPEFKAYVRGTPIDIDDAQVRYVDTPLVCEKSDAAMQQTCCNIM